MDKNVLLTWIRKLPSYSAQEKAIILYVVA